MAAVKISPNVYWVGAIDYDVRDFHGYRTPFGTTYNAYLVIDEKVTLIDTVREKFSDQLFSNIAEVIAPEKIDFIVCNHVEPDHSGSLPEVLARCPHAPVYCSPNGQKGLKAYYKTDGWNFQIVKSGDSIKMGQYSLSFLHTPMVHWPDSMASYLPEQKILFSNDAFGQHIATPERFADEVGYDRVFDSAKDYYANIVMPMGASVVKALAEAGKLDISIIAPSHGVVWRGSVSGILSRYDSWAQYKTRAKLAVIVFDTMWHSTEILAERQAQELRDQGYEVKVMSLRQCHISEVVAAAMEAAVIYVGSPTLNRGMMPQVAALLHYMKGLGFKNRIGRAFGSYGWSGESPALIDEALKDMEFETSEPLKVQYKPV